MYNNGGSPSSFISAVKVACAKMRMSKAKKSAKKRTTVFMFYKGQAIRDARQNLLGRSIFVGQIHYPYKWDALCLGPLHNSPQLISSVCPVEYCIMRRMLISKNPSFWLIPLSRSRDLNFVPSKVSKY